MSIEESAETPPVTRQHRPRWLETLTLLARNPLAIAAVVVLAGLVFAALLAESIVPRDDIFTPDIANRLQAPSGEHWFGTDELGRDVLSRLIMGTRVSLLVAFIATAISLVGGVVLGAVAGFVGGQVDNVIMRVMDVLLALPGILLAIAIVATFGPNIVNVMLAIAVVRIPAMARVVRSEVLALKEEEFVEAGRALGLSGMRILFRHILTNSWAPALVIATLGMGTAIVAEASLSFLGLGTQPPEISWGRMLSVGREAIRSAPHVTLYPGVAITLTVLGFSLLGDGLRDVFDRRLGDA